MEKDPTGTRPVSMRLGLHWGAADVDAEAAVREVFGRLASLTIPELVDLVLVYRADGGALYPAMCFTVRGDDQGLRDDMAAVWDATGPVAEAILGVFADREVARQTLESAAHGPASTASVLMSAGMRDLLHVRLGEPDEPIGVVSFGMSRARRSLTPTTAAILNVVAQHVSAALRVQQVTSAHRALELAMQRSALPAQLPAPDEITVGRWDIAARYRTARSNPVGGDWYDVISQDSGLMVLLGDVAGHGLEAATTMSRLRNVVRAWALEGHGAVRIVELANRFLLFEGAGEMATLAVLAIGKGADHAELVLAGHPPPVVCHHDGASVATAPSGPPLGALDSGAWTAATLDLSDVSGFVLYSDGLVEDQSTPMDQTIEGLRASLGAVDGLGREITSAGLAGRVLSDSPIRTFHDDVCVLALVRLGEDVAVLDRTVRAGADQVSVVRDQIRNFALAHDLEHIADDIVLSASELVTNAIAATRSDDLIHVRLTVLTSDVELVVANRGDAFVRPTASHDPLAPRGRGLSIIEKLGAALAIEHDGTRTYVLARIERARRPHDE